MKTRSCQNVFIAAGLAIIGSAPLVMWVEMALLEGVQSANVVAGLCLKDSFFQVWSALSIACLVLAVSYLTSLAKSVRGSTLLLAATIVLALLSAAAKIFVVTIVLCFVAAAAYKARALPN